MSLESPFSSLDLTRPPPSPASTDTEGYSFSHHRQKTRLPSDRLLEAFDLPSDQVLLDQFYCALLSRKSLAHRKSLFLIQGVLYLFEEYLCFWSNLFGFETKIVIPLEEVTSVKKKKHMGFPNSIQIERYPQASFFTSFLFRNKTYRKIEAALLRKRPELRDKLLAEQNEMSDHRSVGSSRLEENYSLDASPRVQSLQQPNISLSIGPNSSYEEQSNAGASDHWEAAAVRASADSTTSTSAARCIASAAARGISHMLRSNRKARERHVKPVAEVSSGSSQSSADAPSTKGPSPAVAGKCRRIPFTAALALRASRRRAARLSRDELKSQPIAAVDAGLERKNSATTQHLHVTLHPQLHVGGLENRRSINAAKRASIRRRAASCGPRSRDAATGGTLTPHWVVQPGPPLPQPEGMKPVLEEQVQCAVPQLAELLLSDDKSVAVVGQVMESFGYRDVVYESCWQKLPGSVGGGAQVPGCVRSARFTNTNRSPACLCIQQQQFVVYEGNTVIMQIQQTMPDLKAPLVGKIGDQFSVDQRIEITPGPEAATSRIDIFLKVTMAKHAGRMMSSLKGTIENGALDDCKKYYASLAARLKEEAGKQSEMSRAPSISQPAAPDLSATLEHISKEANAKAQMMSAGDASLPGYIKSGPASTPASSPRSRGQLLHGLCKELEQERGLSQLLLLLLLVVLVVVVLVMVGVQMVLAMQIASLQGQFSEMVRHLDRTATALAARDALTCMGPGRPAGVQPTL